MYDLIVIGGGSGGVAAARRLAARGKNVALIEKDRIGGTCVMRGCVPKKLFWYAATGADSIDIVRDYGWDVSSGAINWSFFIQKKRAELDRLEGIYYNLLKNSGVQVFSGHGKLLDENTVQIDGDKLLHGNNILIATGSTPNPLLIDGSENAITSDQVLEFDALPQSVAIIGSGFIAVELASILNNLGVAVHLLLKYDSILLNFDQEAAGFLLNTMKSRGINVYPAANVTKITTNTVHVDNTILNVTSVINAVGRRPLTENLGLEKLGIKCDKQGSIIVDVENRTNISNIFAVGDVVNDINLTPFAIKQGRALADRLSESAFIPLDRTALPMAVFSYPQMASAGISQEKAIAMGIAVNVYKSTFRPMKYTLTNKTDKIFMKLIVDQNTDKVLGCVMVGDDAAEIIQGFGVAITCGATKAQFDATLAIHPSSAEEFVTMV